MCLRHHFFHLPKFWTKVRDKTPTPAPLKTKVRDTLIYHNSCSSSDWLFIIPWLAGFAASKKEPRSCYGDLSPCNFMLFFGFCLKSSQEDVFVLRLFLHGADVHRSHLSLWMWRRNEIDSLEGKWLKLKLACGLRVIMVMIRVCKSF